MWLSIPQRQQGGGEGPFGRNAEPPRPPFLCPFLFPLPPWRLGVTAPVCLMFNPSASTEVCQDAPSDRKQRVQVKNKMWFSCNRVDLWSSLGPLVFKSAPHTKKKKGRAQPLDCVKFSPSKERDLFRLACHTCWEILECVEWGTVVLVHRAAMKPNVSVVGLNPSTNLTRQKFSRMLLLIDELGLL